MPFRTDSPSAFDASLTAWARSEGLRHDDLARDLRRLAPSALPDGADVTQRLSIDVRQPRPDPTSSLLTRLRGAPSL